MFALVAYSLLLVGVALGMLKAPEEIGGAKIDTDIAAKAYLISGAIAVSVLFNLFFALDRHSDEVARVIRSLFNSDGYTHDNLDSKWYSPLESHHPLLVAMAPIAEEGYAKSRLPVKVFDFFSWALTAMLLFVIPLVTQVVVLSWVVEHDGWVSLSTAFVGANVIYVAMVIVVNFWLREDGFLFLWKRLFGKE